MTPRPLPPGPAGHFFSGNLAEFNRDRLGFLTRCARVYGDFVPLRFGLRGLFLLSHPDLVEAVLVTNHRCFIKSYAMRQNRLMLGNGLATSEGAFWLRQRRLVQPAFQRSRLAAHAEVMVAEAERLLAGWRDGETRDLHAEMMRLTLQIAVKTLFGAEVGRDAVDVEQAIHAALASHDARLKSVLPVPEWLPTPGNLRLRRAVRRLDAVMDRIIAQRRADGVERDDVLSLLLQARDAEGRAMSDRQLRDEAITLLLTSHETIALVLSWTWYLLARHPRVEARLRAEWDAVLGGRPPRAADLPQLRFTEQVVTESIRLYPPAYVLARDAALECAIDGYRIPAGSTVLMSPWVLHRDERFFEAPDRFWPERWADDRMQRLPRYAYFPFGGGPRLCIGSDFARTEAALVLATVGQPFRFALLNEPVTPYPSFTLCPQPGARVRVIAAGSGRRPERISDLTPDQRAPCS